MARIVPTSTDVNFTRLVELVAAESGVSEDEVRKVLRGTFDVIGRTVLAGHKVTVTNFGSWAGVRKAARYARNPQTGNRVLVPARLEGRFRWSQTIVNALATGQRLTTLAKSAKHAGPRAQARESYPDVRLAAVGE